MMRYTISSTVYDVLARVARDVVEDGRTSADYSGRGMNSRTCLALICNDLTGLVRWTFGLQAAIEGEPDDVAEQLAALVDELSSTFTVRTDQLGYRQVYYWPDVEVEAVEPDDE